MAKPYTSAQKDTLIDQLLADVAELKKQAASGGRKGGDDRPARPDRETRIARRQETNTAEIDQQQVVVRPSVERIRRSDGKVVMRVTRPR